VCVCVRACVCVSVRVRYAIRVDFGPEAISPAAPSERTAGLGPDSVSFLSLFRSLSLSLALSLALALALSL